MWTITRTRLKVPSISFVTLFTLMLYHVASTISRAKTHSMTRLINKFILRHRSILLVVLLSKIKDWLKSYVLFVFLLTEEYLSQAALSLLSRIKFPVFKLIISSMVYLFVFATSFPFSSKKASSFES